MPKYEIEPGRYGFKRPKPIDRGKTTKEMLLQSSITEEDLNRVESRASIELAGKWLRNRREDFETLENCDECLNKLTDTVWQTDEKGQVLEPVFTSCEKHPELVKDWIYEQLETMFEHLEKDEY